MKDKQYSTPETDFISIYNNFHNISSSPRALFTLFLSVSPTVALATPLTNKNLWGQAADQRQGVQGA
jgi:hypothetical protein